MQRSAEAVDRQMREEAVPPPTITERGATAGAPEGWSLRSIDNRTMAILIGLVGGAAIYFRGVTYEVNHASTFAAMLVLQAVYAGTGVTEAPKRLRNVMHLPAVRLGILACAAYLVTRDPITSVAIIAVFLAVLHLLRDPEERARHPFLL